MGLLTGKLPPASPPVSAARARRRWAQQLVPALLLGVLGTLGAAWLPLARADEPAAEDSLEVLRQRLAERLANKAEPVGPLVPLKGVGKGADEGAYAPGKGGRAAARAGGKADAAGKGAKSDAAQAPRKPASWGYAGDGAPERWAELSPDNRLCAVGTRQSPIDIRDTIKVDLEKIQFDYRPSNFAVLDNGHTVQVNMAEGNALQVMGRRFELQQFHFHRPGEERINGRQYDMVVHLVHKDADGRLAVVAVLLERGPDNKPQSQVQTVWNNLPLEKNDAISAPVQLDPAKLLPEDRAYYTYMGSLTEPPCTEGVLWMVMRQPVQLTAGQIAIFSKLYPMNARPVQAGAGRLIKESN
ncbi:MAG: carbonic anhydrase family protein [Burkholderiaceae bacterium]